MADFQSRATKEKRSELPRPAAQKSEEPSASVKIDVPPTPKTLERLRALVGAPFMRVLRKLDSHYRQEARSQRQQIEINYNIWAETYKTLNDQFSELWDFFSLVEHEANGWLRVAPMGTKSFLGINEEGYSFAAGIELNHTRGAPHPKKWMIVSLAYSVHWVSGLGDERRLGRASPIDGKLAGLNGCNIKDLKKSIEGSKELRKRAENTPLVFQMFSESVGQRGVKIPAQILNEHSLVDLCKGLFVALNKDILNDPKDYLPAAAEMIAEK